MKILDRHLIGLGLGRWGLVLFIGTFLILLGDFIGELGDYLSALTSSRWWIFFLYELVRLPGFVQGWLPWSTLVAALLTAAPMIGQGTLTALGAAGIAPARVFRTFVILALLTCLTSFVLLDQVVPRLSPLVERVSLAMVGKGDLRSDHPTAAGWRSGGTVWSAVTARPVVGVFIQVAAFRTDASRRMLNAQRLVWQDGAWLLQDVVVVEGEVQRSYAQATPTQLGFELGQARPALAEALRADDSRTSDELFAAGAQRRWQIICQRLASAMLPLLCLLYGLPRFISWNDRTRLAIVGFTSLLWALIPLVAVMLLGRLLVSAGAQPIFLALGVLGAVTSVGVVRWRRMRL
jgi:lipopolysaccharide export LptBFGC system permease protein LptF